jgi:hypothetical protein
LKKGFLLASDFIIKYHLIQYLQAKTTVKMIKTLIFLLKKQFGWAGWCDARVTIDAST